MNFSRIVIFLCWIIWIEERKVSIEVENSIVALAEKGYSSRKIDGKVGVCNRTVPALNSIENLWAILKRKLAQYETPPSDFNELWIRIEAEWRKINEETIQKLVESMPKYTGAKSIKCNTCKTG